MSSTHSVLEELGTDPFAGSAPPEVAAVRAGEDLDWTRIEPYLRAQLPELSGAFAVLQFPNGAANLTYLLRFGDTELVLRRPPFGVLAPGAHDMKREYRVLSRLWRYFDRAPRAYVFCDDKSVAGADFFVMERRRGEVIRGVIPLSMRHHPDVGRRVGLAVAEATAELHLLDPVTCELGDLGKPAGFVERQVDGWKHRWDLVKTEKTPPAMDDIAHRLAQRIPAAQRVSFVHNDLKLDNSQFDPASPDRVRSFFDWDMTTLGDPLVDLGTLLNYWPDPSDPPDAHRTSHAGMERMGLPTRAEMVERYAARTRLDVAQVPWYEAFAQWKTAVVVQQLHARWLRGESSDPRMEHIANGIPRLAATAQALLEKIGL